MPGCSLRALLPWDTESMSASDHLSPTQFPVEHLLPLVNSGTADPQVRDYAEAMKSGEWRGESTDEPITKVTWDDGTSVLNDGSHRVRAAHLAGLTHVDAVHERRSGPAPEWATTLRNAR